MAKTTHISRLAHTLLVIRQPTLGERSTYSIPAEYLAIIDTDTGHVIGQVKRDDLFDKNGNRFAGEA